jgi:hypothetical protein
MVCDHEDMNIRPPPPPPPPIIQVVAPLSCIASSAGIVENLYNLVIQIIDVFNCQIEIKHER